MKPSNMQSEECLPSYVLTWVPERGHRSRQIKTSPFFSSSSSGLNFCLGARRPVNVACASSFASQRINDSFWFRIDLNFCRRRSVVIPCSLLPRGRCARRSAERGRYWGWRCRVLICVKVVSHSSPSSSCSGSWDCRVPDWTAAPRYSAIDADLTQHLIGAALSGHMRVLRMIGLLSCLACRAGVHFRLYQGVFAQFRGLNTSSMCRICLDSVSFARRAVVDDLAGRSSCWLLISRGISCYEVLLLRPPPERRDPRYDDLALSLIHI